MDKPLDPLDTALVGASVYDCPILIVDDEPLMQEFIKEFLMACGFKSINTADDGLHALEKLEDWTPDLIILDIQMPKMDGFETLNRIREREHLRTVPIIVQTANDNLETREKSMALKADNIIAKPINGEILIQRVTHHLERLIMTRQLTEFRDNMKRELLIAKEMQEAIVPSRGYIEKVERKYGVQIFDHFMPSFGVGGDLWGITEVDDDRFGVYMLDVSGHGVASALNAFRINAMIQMAPQIFDIPSNLLAYLNENLVDSLMDGQFATMMYMVIDIRERRVQYAGAAAPNPLFGHTEASEHTFGDGAGLPLGAIKNAPFTNHEVSLDDGTPYIFLYSDALSEAECSSGDRIEDEGVMALAGEAAQVTASPVNHIVDRFESMANDPRNDDLTMVWIFL